MENPSQSHGASPAMWNNTCHLTQMFAPNVNPRQVGWYLTCLPRCLVVGWRLSWLWCWLYTEMVYWYLSAELSIQVWVTLDNDPTGSRIHDLSILSPTYNRYNTKSPCACRMSDRVRETSPPTFNAPLVTSFCTVTPLIGVECTNIDC